MYLIFPFKNLSKYVRYTVLLVDLVQDRLTDRTKALATTLNIIITIALH